jgi:hypothetical protein
MQKAMKCLSNRAAWQRGLCCVVAKVLGASWPANGRPNMPLVSRCELVQRAVDEVISAQSPLPRRPLGVVLRWLGETGL